MQRRRLKRQPKISKKHRKITGKITGK
ncbi:MAG: hypothetical protein RI894_1922, partial [Bacteroidota bacterium]